MPLDAGDPLDVLAVALSHRQRLVIVLDNFEQIVAVAPETVEAWCHRAPGVCWLITSRQRLDLPGERLVLVDPLPLPDASEDVAADLSRLHDNASVQLFVDRARAVQPRFALTATNAPHVARLVALLDGLPFAIELAAARVRVLPPKRILDRMNRRFDLLRGQRGRRSRTGARQATLEGAIDWSWNLLAPHERSALAQCSVFEGGFDLEAAEGVLDLSAWPDAPWPMDTLESLVDQSLVRTVVQADGETRFALFRSIHDYAAAKLADPAAVSAAAGSGSSLERGPELVRQTALRHAEHYARWGEVEELALLHQLACATPATPPSWASCRASWATCYSTSTTVLGPPSTTKKPRASPRPWPSATKASCLSASTASLRPCPPTARVRPHEACAPPRLPSLRSDVRPAHPPRR